jgi:hypothetical protein
MAGKEYTLKNINETVTLKKKEGEKDIKYKIEYKNDKGNDKMSVDNDSGTRKVTASKITKIVEGSGEEDVSDKSVEIEYDKDGWFFHSGKVKKVGGEELKEEIKVGFSGLNSYRPTFWISIVALLLLVGGFI